MFSPSSNIPTVAVCLAAFNGIRYLPQQVDSILNQLDSDVTLFVSVDCSTDGTEEWFAHLQTLNTKVVLLPFGRRFGGAARNFFRLLREVDFSAFDVVAFADQDDIWRPEKLKRATDTLIERGADGYSSDVVAFWDSGKSSYIKKSYPQRHWDYLFESAGPGCTFVFTCKLAIDIQMKLRKDQRAADELGLHDWFTYAYARAHGYKWVIDEYASLMYRQHAGNQVGVNAGFAAFIWRVRQVLNGWGLNQARMIAILVGHGDDAFVQRWSNGSRLGILMLAFEAPQCRRRTRDQVLFAISCLVLSVLGWK